MRATDENLHRQGKHCRAPFGSLGPPIFHSFCPRAGIITVHTYIIYSKGWRGGMGWDGMGGEGPEGRGREGRSPTRSTTEFEFSDGKRLEFMETRAVLLALFLKFK